MHSDLKSRTPRRVIDLRRTRWSCLFVLLLVSIGRAWATPIASDFTCKANGDTWSVVSNAVEHKVSCSVRCLLHDAQGQQDSIVCSPQLTPGSTSAPICEGFMLGKRWVSAELVAVSCSATE